MLSKPSLIESHQLRRTLDKTASESEDPRGAALATTKMAATRSIRLKMLRRPIAVLLALLQRFCMV